MLKTVNNKVFKAYYCYEEEKLATPLRYAVLEKKSEGLRALVRLALY